jgi:hypothetical protein
MVRSITAIAFEGPAVTTTDDAFSNWICGTD